MLTFTIKKGRKLKPLATLYQASFQIILEGFKQKAKTALYPGAENFAITEHLSLKLNSQDLRIDNQ